MAHHTIRVPAARYEDYDDCLTAAAHDAADEYGIHGYDMDPRWADDDRDEILLDIPLWLARELGVLPS